MQPVLNLHCRVCFEMTNFIAYEPDTTDPDLFECERCGFQWGKAIKMTEYSPDGTVESVLSPDVVAKGAERYADHERRLRLRHGIPMRLSPKVRNELRRRSGIS